MSCCTSLSSQILTNFSRRLSLLVPKVLHDAQAPKTHLPCSLHEAVCGTCLRHRRCCRSCKNTFTWSALAMRRAHVHGVVNAFARRGAPPRQQRRPPAPRRGRCPSCGKGFMRQGGTLAAQGGAPRPNRRSRASGATALRSEKPLSALPVPTLTGVAVRETPTRKSQVTRARPGNTHRSARGRGQVARSAAPG